MRLTPVRKTQGFLKVLANPFCQLGGQPAKDRVAAPVHIFQRFWRESHVRGESLVLQLESAGLKKVDIKAHTTSRLYGASLCIQQYVKYKTVHSSTYKYVLVCTSMNRYIHNYKSILPTCVTLLNVDCT